MNQTRLPSLSLLSEIGGENRPLTHRYYWTCQIVGWIIHMGWAFFIATFSRIDWFVTMHVLTSTVYGLLLTHYFRHNIITFDWFRLSFPKIITRIILGSFIVSFFLLALDVGTAHMLDSFMHEEFRNKVARVFTIPLFILSLFNTTIVIMLWSVFYFGFHFFKTYRQTEIEKWKMEAAVKEAELIALKSQINPHFIFNSLNNIRGLIIESPEKARDMITHLSDLLRYSIRLNQNERVPLDEELEIVENYLQLESIQLEERLKYFIEVDENTRQVKIPPMVIQILVENAIKHGIANLPQGGEIKIRAKKNSEQHIDIEVLNTGRLKNQPSLNGVGLKNASQRLQLLAKSLKGIELNNLGEEMVSARFSLNTQESL